MKKISYVILERKTIKSRLGGYSHIKGMCSALKDSFQLKLVAENANFLFSEIDGVEFFEVKKKCRSFYLGVAAEILKDKETDVFIFRKNFIGMYLVFLIFLIKRVSGKKQKHIYEVNGISGDYKIKNKIFNYLMLFLNVIPLKLCDGVYCVTESIRSRLSRFVSNEKLFVCRNGGPEKNFPPIVYSIEDGFDLGVDIYFFGSDQMHYHINDICEKITSFNKYNHDCVRLHLIGPNMGKYSSDNINVYGSKSIDELYEILSQGRGKKFGIVPLNKYSGGYNVEPIKVFDYFALSLPILYSEYCLQGHSEYKNISFEYSLSGIEKKFDELCSISVKEYNELSLSVFRKYSDFKWSSRLDKLNKYIYKLNIS